MSDEFFESPAEQKLSLFTDPSVQMGPRSPQWGNRVKAEMMNVKTYLDYLAESKQNLWFFLAPLRDRQYKFRIWKGELKIPQRADISFDMIILLPSEYPKVFPQAFVEKDLVQYAAKNLYLNSTYEHEGKTYVMICHDHLEDLDVWDPSLSIAHFLLREILVWWNSRIETVITQWDNRER